MKNNKSIILGILIIILVCIITVGCGFYNLLKPKDFKEHFGALGYTIMNLKMIMKLKKYIMNTMIILLII